MIPFFDVIENNVFFPNKKKKILHAKAESFDIDFFFHLVSGNYFLSKLKKKIVFSI